MKVTKEFHIELAGIPHNSVNVMSSFLDAHYQHQQGFCRAHQSVNGHFVHWQKEPDFLSKRRRPIIG